MQIHVDRVTDVKDGTYGISSKIWSGNASWFINDDATSLVGKDIEITEEEKTSAQNRRYKTAKLIKVLGQSNQADNQSAPGNGKLEWKEYEQLARVAHKLAKEIEPDQEDTTGFVDRSRARITFVNTALMALKDGKLWLEDDIPF